MAGVPDEGVASTPLIASEREVPGSVGAEGVSCRDDVPVALERDGVRVLPPAAEVGRLLAVAGKARVERAVGVVAKSRVSGTRSRNLFRRCLWAGTPLILRARPPRDFRAGGLLGVRSAELDHQAADLINLDDYAWSVLSLDSDGDGVGCSS